MNDQYPLAGLKVLDFSRVLAGPFAGRMLSDLGADVVKIEPPDGDVTRLWGRVIGNLPGYYHQQNAGKRNICIDLRHPDARALVLSLATSADVVIENYRPGVMQRLGIDFESLSAVNPRLIMLSISGFGQTGPESGRPAYAPIVHAEAGLIHRAARQNALPAHDLPLSIADTNASLHGLVGVLSALLMRERTGEGQHIDIAMLDATLATDDKLHYDLESSEDTGPLPSGIWQTGAGPMLIAGDVRHVWKMLVEHFDVADPAAQVSDLETKAALRRGVIENFLARLDSWDDVEPAMATMNLAWGEVRDPAAMREQRTVRARGAIVDVDDRAGDSRPITQSPYRFSGATSGVRGPAPHRGEHNVEVLRDWLDKGPDDVARLEQLGVLVAGETER